MPNYIVDATIAEITALTNLSKLSDTYYSTDNLKQGIWTLDESTPPVLPIPEEIGATVIIDKSNNIWRRLIYNDEYMPEWFGATADSGHTNPADDHDDAGAISNAIKAAKNKTVIFTGGKTYAIGRKIRVNNPVRLAGTGTLLKIYDPDDGEGIGNDGPVILIENTSDVIIEDLTINGNKANLVFEGITPLFYGIEIKSISTSLVKRVKFNNLTIKDTYQEGILADSCSDLTISGCYVENCNLPCDWTATRSGILVKAEATNAQNVTISDCRIDQRGSKNECMKIYARQMVLENVIITNNICLIADVIITTDPPEEEDDTTIIGIECFTKTVKIGVDLFSATFSNLIISGNIIDCTPITGTQRYHGFGISLGGGTEDPAPGKGMIDVVVSNNIIRNCKRYGIEVIVKNASIIGNELYNCGYIGINADLIAGGMFGVEVIGNRLTTNVGESVGFHQQYGGILVKAIEYNMYGTLIEGNILEVTGSYTGADTIYIQTGSGTGGTGDATGKLVGLSIINNQLLNIARHGISFESTVNAEDVNITGNIFKYNPALPAPDSGALTYAIALNNPKSIKNLSITNNTADCRVVLGNRNGIRITGGSAVYNNFIITNTALGIYIARAVNGLIITENIFDVSATPVDIVTLCLSVIFKDNIYKNAVNTPPQIDAQVQYLEPVVDVDPGGPYTAAQLNASPFANVALGQRIVCIGTTANVVYQKVALTGTAQWIQYSTTLV
jgi:hypothetical protein